MIDRRTLLIGFAALGFAASTRAMGQPESIFVRPTDSFFVRKADRLGQRAQRKTLSKPVVHDPALVERIDFDAYQQIKFRPELAIWGGGDGPYPIELFHVGRFLKPFASSSSLRRGRRRRLAIVPTFLPMGKANLQRRFRPTPVLRGFAFLPRRACRIGLHSLERPTSAVLAETGQYGLSSRGLAIDVAMPAPEEFPRFSQFWLEPMAGRRGVIINALLIHRVSPALTASRPHMMAPH